VAARKKKTDWAAARADYEAGDGFSEISKRYDIPLGEVAVRAGNERWKRKPKKAEEPKPESNETIPAVIEPERVGSVLEEAVNDVIRGHKSLSRKLRAQVEFLLEECEAMLQHTASFRNEVELQQLKAKADEKQDPKPLLEYLLKAMGALKLGCELVEKLGRSYALLIQHERKAWGISDEDSGAAEEVSYDELLEEMTTPIAPNSLDSKVIDFAQRAQQQRRI
jgi:hypothetical protein